MLGRSVWTGVLLAAAACASDSGGGETGSTGTTDPSTSGTAAGSSTGNDTTTGAESSSSAADGSSSTGEPLFGSAQFRVVIDGTPEDIQWAPADGNHVYCRVFADADGFLGVRFALQPDNDGEDTRHLDIDVCGFLGTGTFSPFDPAVPLCRQGGFGIWWFESLDEAWANDPAAAACSLDVTYTPDDMLIVGTFACDDLDPVRGGGSSIAVEDGSFECRLEVL